MSQHNELQKYPALQRALSAATGMDPREEGVTRLGETLTPVIDPWSLPEWAFLRDEVLGAGFAGQGAVAAEFSAVALHNPTGSGRILVVEKAIWRVGAVAQQVAGLSTEALVTATLGTINGTFSRDSRLTPANFQTVPGQNVSVARLLNGTDPALGNIQPANFENLAGSVANQDFEAKLLPMIVEPGFAYVVACTAVNTTLTVNLAWRERRVQAAEL